MQTPPLIDARSFADLVAQTERLLQRYSDWQRVMPSATLLTGRVLAEDVVDPVTGEVLATRNTLVDALTAQRIARTGGLGRIAVVPVPDVGSVLVRISAHLTELLVQRVNRIPEKNFLAFLDLLGLSPLPPQVARVPLTFRLAAGSTDDALVPALTAVGATLAEGESTPVLFQTERDLVVTRSRLTAVRIREPACDRTADRTRTATAGGGEPFAVFEGNQPIGHRLLMGDRHLSAEALKTLTLRVYPADGTQSWLSALAFSRWDGTDWQDLPATVTPKPVDGAWEVTLPDVPGIPATPVAGATGHWLRASLTTPLPHAELIDVDPSAARTDLAQDGLPPDAVFAEDIPLALDRPLYPFGRTVPRSTCYLACDPAFGKPGAHVRLGVVVDTARPARPTANLVLLWEYWDGGHWAELGRSGPSAPPPGTPPFRFADPTQAFTRDGTVSFTCPAAWRATTVNGLAHRWLRVRIGSGGYGAASGFRPPVLLATAFSYRWPLPRISAIRASAAIARRGLHPDAVFANRVPVDPADRFLPFGQSPTFGAELLLVGEEAFAMPGAWVTLDLPVANPARPEPRWPLPPVKASADLVLAWEYWNGQEWAELGRTTPLPGERLLEPYVTPFDTDTLVLTGERPTGAVVEVAERHTGRQATADPGQGPTWTTRHPHLTAGSHAFLITARTDDGPAGEPRWAFAFRATAGITAADLALDPALAPTSRPRVTVSGRAAVEGGRVLVHNAATDEVVTADFSGRFTVDAAVRKGRNDLLVLVADDTERYVAGEVLPVVRGDGPPISGFTDSTWAFTRSGQVTWRVPADVARRDVQGRPQVAVRARLAAGNYGLPAAYTPTTGTEGSTVTDTVNGALAYRLAPATFRPPSIGPLLVRYDYVSPYEQPQQLLTDNDDLTEAVTGTATFIPFTPTVDSEATLYLGFRRPGTDAGFAPRTVTLYFGVAETRYGSPEGVVGHDASEPPVVVWEYWNGRRWAPLGVRDETSGFTRRGLVTFIGPADFRSSTEFGETACWLRARKGRGRSPSTPRLYRVLTNTMWAAHTRTVRAEQLGSGNGEPGQTFRIAMTPVLPGERIEVRETEPPSAQERAIIEAEGGLDAVTTEPGSGDDPATVWVRWHRVPDFHESGPRSRHYVLERGSGEIGFGDGRRGLVVPQGRANVRAAEYRAGGGSVGNRPAGALSQLKSAVPGVEGVTNEEPARGGSAPESPQAIAERGPRTLRHGDRAVAISDYEDLALQASTDVARAKGIPAGTMAQGGRVTVVVVPRDADPRPVPDLALLARVTDHLAARLSPTIDAQVTGPAWLRISVTAEVVPTTPDLATEAQGAIHARLTAFLHPLTGGPGGRGWEFGRTPHRSELYPLIESVPGVDHVRTLRITVASDPDGAEPARLLVHSGDHDITMVSEPGGDDGPASP
ncbi:hypothetical protein ADK86_03250 [Streptomyces sp. NRRL F-5755]|uniref:putative baseplate assembly protein n=1 Tax=Streptomyces sp. NRRL F-5755 TaxID=1519475 RepID=UPI0006AF8D18|nr:putative baseplate assembly protein [Streptomyces sp. NRRL F-5755]KOU08790.1 hypothetical protein ADK86_03250 [Streptomyces sp. NRRL F-5755]